MSTADTQEQDNAPFTFVIPGRPLTADSPPAAFAAVRQQLTDQATNRNLPFPIPADMAVELNVVFKYPSGAAIPHILDMQRIGTEICLGSLYVDNNSVCSKSINRGVAADAGSTIIRIDVMA